jgi:hypothetical protein
MGPMNAHNKLECLSQASLSTLVKFLWVQSGAYTRLEYLKDVILGKALALLANNRLGWKNFPGTNTLAYYEQL